MKIAAIQKNQTNNNSTNISNPSFGKLKLHYNKSYLFRVINEEIPFVTKEADKLAYIKSKLFLTVIDILDEQKRNLSKKVKIVAESVDSSFFKGKKAKEIFPNRNKLNIEAMHVGPIENDMAVCVSAKIKEDMSGFKLIERSKSARQSGSKINKENELSTWAILFKDAINRTVQATIEEGIVNNAKYINYKSVNDVLESDPQKALSNLKNIYGI